MKLTRASHFAIIIQPSWSTMRLSRALGSRQKLCSKNWRILLVAFGVSFNATPTWPSIITTFSATSSFVKRSVLSFSKLHIRVDALLTNAGTQFGYTGCAASSAIHRFPIAASRSFSNAVWLGEAMDFGSGLPWTTVSGNWEKIFVGFIYE